VFEETVSLFEIVIVRKRGTVLESYIPVPF
jgi:hypothetical protein